MKYCINRAKTLEARYVKIIRYHSFSLYPEGFKPPLIYDEEPIIDAFELVWNFLDEKSKKNLAMTCKKYANLKHLVISTPRAIYYPATSFMFIT